jgi:hypothetical protein
MGFSRKRVWPILDHERGSGRAETMVQGGGKGGTAFPAPAVLKNQPTRRSE